MKQYKKTLFLAICILLTTLVFNIQPKPIEASNAELATISQPSPTVAELPFSSAETTTIEESPFSRAETTVTGVPSHAIVTDMLVGTDISVGTDIPVGNFSTAVEAVDSHAIVTDIPITAKQNTLAAIPNAQVDVDLSISKSVSTGTDHPGAFISYTLNYANNGANTATGVLITDTVPTEMVVWNVSATPPITDTGALPAYVWQLPDLAPGATGSITIEGVVAVTGGTFTNNATITSADNDTSAANNSSSISFDTIEASFSVGSYGGSNSDKGHSGQQTSDGGYIVAGETQSYGAGGSDFWVLKLDSNGDIVWQKAYGGSDWDFARSIQQTSDGGYIVAGETKSYGAGRNDAWVLKLNSNGNIVWQRTYGGSSDDYAESIKQTSDGGYIVAGNTASFGAGNYDAWVFKLNSSGTLTWSKAYGGSITDQANDIIQDGSSYVVAGQTNSYGAGSNDFWVFAVDSSGNLIWQRSYGGSGTDIAYSITQHGDGQIVAGKTSSFGAGGSDFWIIKLSGSGNVFSQYTYGGSGTDVAFSIQRKQDGSNENVIVAGLMGGRAAMLNLRLGSIVTWLKMYNITGGIDSVQLTSDGGYIAVGNISSNDVLVLKSDSSGSLSDSCAAYDEIPYTSFVRTTTNANGTATSASSSDATVSSSYSSTSPSNSSAALALLCGEPPSWNFSKTADNLTPNAGERITYTLTLANPGPDTITDVALFDTLPAGQSVAGPITMSPPSAGVVGDANTLPALAHSLSVDAGQSIVFTLPVTVTVGGVQENSADILAPGMSTAENATQSITVNAFPTGGNNAVAVDEDSTHTFISSEFLYNDLEADAMDGVKITALPAAGSLTCNGLPVAIGDDCTVSAGVQNLQFTPAPDENGSPYATFTFRVKAATGATYSAATSTMTLNVTPISDPPLGADDAITATENISYTFQTADFSFSDADNDTFAGIQLISVESAGDLEYAGADVIASQTYTDVAQLVFTPAHGEFGNPYAVFNFKLVDSSDTFSSAVYQMTINVTDVIARPTGANDVVTGTEDTPYTFHANNFTFADGDNDTFAGIELAALETAGDLTYSGTAVTVGTVYSDVAQLEFTTPLNANSSPYATFGFHVRDSTAMTSTASYTMTINITPVNDVPTGGDTAVAAIEDIPYTFSAGNFPYDDPVEGDAFGGIRLTSLESAGDLECNGTDVSVGTECTDITQLVFTPALNANGSPYATFQFRTRDDGGAVSTAIYTMTVNVAPTADPPVASDGTVTIVEDTPYPFIATDFPISDPDGDALYAVQITTLESAGNLTYDGQPVTLNAVYTDTTALRFAPSLNGTGSPYSNFQFKLIDTTGITSTASATMTINVTTVDDPPTSANTAVTGTEDILYTFSNGNIPYSDPDGHLFDILIITSLQTAGDLECNGTAVTLLTTCAPADLTFAAPMDDNGSPYATFGFKVRDSSGQESIAYVMSINLTAAPDDPLGGDGLVTIPQSLPYTFTLSDFAYYDGDGDTLNGLNLLTLPLAGTLTHNGLPVSTGLYTDITQFTFTPDPGDTGAPYADFTFQLQDSSGALSLLSYNMSINVQGGNPPTGGDGVVAATEDTLYTFDLADFVYSDPDSDPLTGIWFVSAETNGDLQCNNAEILVGSVCDDVFSLTFAPDANAFGSPYASFDFRLRDASGFLSEDTYTMEINVAAVNDSPVLYSIPLLTATQDVTYIYNIVGADNDIADSLTIANISNFNIPAWLTLTDNGDGTGTLTGKPTNNDVGMYNMDLALSDDAGDSDNQAFFLTVVNENDAPAFTSTGLTAATEDVFYAYDITVADIDVFDPLTITVAAPLPAWLTIGDRGDGTATLTGTPHNADVGNYNISLQVSDFAGAIALQNFTLTVANVNEPPAFTSVPVVAAAQGMAYQYAISAVDNDLNELLTFTLLDGPTWLSVNDYGNGSADLDGAPTFADVGLYPVTLQVEDRDGLTVTQMYTLTVLNTPPTAVDDHASTPINAPVILDLRANDSDSDGNPITIIAVAAPYTGTTTLINAAQARYTPPVDFAGEVVFTYTVSDGANNSTGYAFVDVFSSQPVGVNDTGETVAGYPVTLDVLNNDFDPDGESLLITAVDPMSANGSILIAADGQTLTYLPPAAFVGDAIFGYTLQVADDTAQWQTAVVTVTVRDISSINADLSITRSSTPLTFPEGEARDISSDIYITNNNLTEIAAGVVLTDAINVPVLSGSASSGLGSCHLSSDGATCDLGVVPPGQTVLVHLNYAIGTAPGLAITSTVGSQTTDPLTSNNTVSTTFTVLAGRSTRTAGLIDVTADSFAYVPSTGNTRGLGNVLIGEHFKLSDLADTVEFNTDGIVVITGTLTYVVGDQDIVRGLFGVDTIGNIEFTQVDEVLINDLGGFVTNAPSLTAINLLNGDVFGQATFNLPRVGETRPNSIAFTFNLVPGPYVMGQTLPFAIPYFTSSGNMLKLSAIQATLIRQGSEHYLMGSGEMNLNLPGNNIDRTVPFIALENDGTFANFPGAFELNNTWLNLNIEGANAFTFVDPVLDNNGLHDSAQSILRINSSDREFYNDSSITRYGFNQVGKTVSLPGTTSSVFSVSQPEMRIIQTASAYELEYLDGDLRLRLPQNHRTISGFTLTPGASNADIVLDVGAAQLTLHAPYLDGRALVADSITWKLPDKLGGIIETFNQSVRLDSTNLNGLPFPAHIKAGAVDGVDVDVVSASFRETNGAYQINLNILMHIDLPNTPSEGLAGTLSSGVANTGATLDPFTFTVAGYEIATDGAKFDMEEVRLQVETAEMTYVQEKAGRAAFGLVLKLLGVDGNTIEFADGKARFRLPDICLGTEKENADGEKECKGGASLKDLQADLVQNSDGTYDISAEGAMEWPSGKAPLPGRCSGIEAAISVSYDPGTGRQVFTMIPNASGGVVNMTDARGNSVSTPFTEGALNQPTYIDGQQIPGVQQLSSLPDGMPFGPTGLMLTGASFVLNGCEIPLIAPNGPVFVSKLGGGFEFDDGGVVLRLVLGIDIKSAGQDPSPITINTDSHVFLPKRWIKFSGGCLTDTTIDPWGAEQELSENFFEVEIELESDSCSGTYRFTSLGEGSYGTQVLGTGEGNAPATVKISSRFDKYPWFVRADGEFIYNGEDDPFATGFLEVDPNGVRMELTSSDEIKQYFELEFTGGVNAWVDKSNEFWMTGFLQASFSITLEVLWGILPDAGMDFTARIEFGHFVTNDAEKIIGFKGTATGEVVLVPEVCVPVVGCTPAISQDFSIGFFIDQDFNIATGDDIDNYQLATRSRVLRAYTAMLLSEGMEASPSALTALPLAPNDPDLSFVFATNAGGKGKFVALNGSALKESALLAELLINVAVPYETTTRVTLQSQADGPTMTLEGPDSTLYGHDSLPADITYTEFMTNTTPLGQTTAADQGMGQLRVSHAVADMGVMDVLVNGTPLFTGLTFTDVAAYQNFTPGSYTVAFVAAGTTSPILAQATINLDVGQDATVVATGQTGSMNAWAVEDDNSSRPGGRPYLRLLNLGISLGSVDLMQRMGREYYIDIAYQGIGDYIKMYPMGYTLEVRDNSDQTLLTTLENVQLEEGGIYTLFLFDSISGTVGSLVQDAVAPAQLQIVHVAGDEGVLEISVDGRLITDSLSLGAGTVPTVMALGSHQIEISDGGSILISETVTLDTAVPYAYVIDSASGTTDGRLISNDQLASYGFVNARLLHLAPSVPDVDVTIFYGLGNETPLFSGVGFGELSGQFNVQERITTTIVMRLAGTPQVLYTFNDVSMPMGDVLTLYLYEQGGVPKLATATDTSMAIKTTAMYILEAAEVGNWVVHLQGDVINGDDYKLLVDGDKPLPIFQDVEIVDVAGQPTLQWRLISPLPETTVGLYYKSGSITETEVISQDGELITSIVELYNGHTFTGTLSAPSDPNWTNGTLQQYPIDLTILENGSYSIYLTANDLDGGITRAAAPDPLVVNHIWPTTWDASLAILNEGYREIRADWTRFPSPEAEQYTLIGISESGLRQEARLSGNTFNPYQTLGNLTPGETYTFTVQAWDGQSLGRVTASEAVRFTVPGATFTVTGAADFSVDVGQSLTTVITLSTTLDPYPALVGLSAGARSDGVSIRFSEDIVTPTLAGTPVEVYLDTSAYLPGGTYTATVEASGGGETVLFEYQTAVTAPSFDLTATPDVPLIIEEGDVLAMTVGATRYEGHTDEIWFTVQDLPMVDWMVDTSVLSDTIAATLTITDTTLLQHGTYTFTLYAEDGRSSSTITRTLVVNKPTYSLSAATETIVIATDITETVQVPLTLTVGIQGNWNTPVTLMLNPKMAPPFAQVGFGALMEAFVEVSAPDEVVLWVEAPPQTPSGTYLLPIIAESDGRQEQVYLFLKVFAGNVSPVAISDVYTATEDVVLNVLAPGVLWNDTDVNMDLLMAIPNTDVSNGILALASDGSFVYTPTPDFCGRDSFTYYANDGTLSSNMESVIIDVACVNETIFLPLVTNNYVSQPDLVVADVIITADSLAVVIRNDGNTHLSDGFWVDMYINPDTPPTGVNQTWETQGGEGLAWGVSTPSIAAGESLTLTLRSSSYDAGAGNFSGTIAAGSKVYVQVDSVGSWFGNVQELDEDNNISGPVVVTVPSTPSNVLTTTVFSRKH